MKFKTLKSKSSLARGKGYSQELLTFNGDVRDVFSLFPETYDNIKKWLLLY